MRLASEAGPSLDACAEGEGRVWEVTPEAPLEKGPGAGEGWTRNGDGMAGAMGTGRRGRVETLLKSRISMSGSGW